MVALEVELGPDLTAEEAGRIFERGKEAAVFAMLQLAMMLKSRGALVEPSPSTPSGMIAAFQKPTVPTKGKRKKRPGAKLGHAGHRRAAPERIDRYEEHRAEVCPDCGGELTRCSETRTRYVEDIPEDLAPQVTEHTIHRDWCPQCRCKVEPKIGDALPGSMLGNRVLVLSAFLHFSLGNTLSQIVDVINFHLQLKLTSGGLMQMWQRLAQRLEPWYEQLQAEGLNSAVLHADESGWRVNGKTHWLWCFSNPDLTYYMIDRCRGGPALAKFFITEFEGTLVSDFWGAYNGVECALRQTCLVHLLRDLETVEKYKPHDGDWPDFAKKLRRLVGDAIRLWKRQDELDVETYQSRSGRFPQRLDDLIHTPWSHPEAQRLIKRLRRHADDLFTFLEQDGVPFDNNHAERAIRPAVIMRKNSYGNRSDRGAETQSILMSLFRTLKQRDLDPIQTTLQALAEQLTTGQLPPLPPRHASDG